MLKVTVLGGAGHVGMAVVRDLIETASLDHLAIIDVDEAKARRRCERAGISGQVSIRSAQLEDRARLVRELEGSRLVVNCTGPFYWSARPAVTAAIEVEAHYVDVCDDWEGTRDTLALNDAAREAGVTVITGIGYTPGTANVLARMAADRLDEVHAVNMSWAAASSDAGGLAASHHSIDGLTGWVPQFLDGSVTEVEAGTGRQSADFGDPVGVTTVCYFGHPEPLTIPRCIEGVTEVTTRGGGLSTTVVEEIVRLGRLGLTSETPISVGGVEVAPRDVLLACWAASDAQAPADPSPRSAILVEVHGQSLGAPASIACSYATAEHSMATLTGVPASIGAQLVLSGAIAGRGVLTPEEAIPAGSYFDELARRGISGFWERTSRRLPVS